jgi:phospholipid/cholesterol/gamma-HCH transport system substrate-binding protein
MTSYVKKQLIVFASLSLAAVLIIVFVYAHIPTVLGFGQNRLSAVFTDGAGVYVNSNVTNRGVVIGKVDKITLQPDGNVQVDMYYDNTYDIPDDARAEIHSISAVGEIYVEVTSERAGGPFLASGAVIPVERTSVPEQIAPVLDKVTKFLDSIPNNGLQTFLDEGSKAFQNLGPDMRTLLESASALTASADQHYQQTHDMIQNIGPLLDTQVVNNYGKNVQQYFKDLAHFTSAFRDQDQHLRDGIDPVAYLVLNARLFLEDNEATAPIVFRNAITVAHLLGVYRDNLEQLLVQEPIMANRLQRGVRGHGLQVSFVTAVWSGCTRGFKGNDLRNPNDLTDKDPPVNFYCKIPHDAQSFVRGARNIPCSEGYKGMRAATIDECFGRRPDQTPGSSGQLPFTSAPFSMPLMPQRTPLDPPDNQRNYQHDIPAKLEPMAPFGAKSTAAPLKEASWQSLLAGPLTN